MQFFQQDRGLRTTAITQCDPAGLKPLSWRLWGLELTEEAG